MDHKALLKWTTKAVAKITVPATVRHGNIRKSSTLPAVSSDTSRKACAVRWQITNDSITSALTRRRVLLEKTCRQTMPCLVARSARPGGHHSNDRRRLELFPFTPGGRALDKPAMDER